MLGFPAYLNRLLPGNPILRRVVETGGKRRRDLVIRCAYLGLLIFFVISSLASSNFGGQSLGELAKTSASVFQTLSIVQLVLVALLAPVFTAGAITQEKDSQTYDILLSTPLTNAQIIVGSLFSRLFFVFALLISGIPIFAITQIFGGVAISSILMSFLIAAATALVTGAMAMAIATFKVGTRRTIFSFYMLIVIYLVGGLLLDRVPALRPVIGFETNTLGQLVMDAGHPVPIHASTSWLTGLNPYLALRTIFFEKDYLPPDFGSLPANLQGWPIGWMLSSPASFYVGLMSFISFVLILPSIVLLRRLAQSTVTMRGWVLQKLHISSGDRTRKPRTVWANPIAWREAKTKASAARGVVMRYGFMSVGLIGAIVLLVGFSTTVPATRSIDRHSYNPAAHSLMVYTADAAVRYAVDPHTQVTIKTPGAEDKAGTLDDLYGHYAIEPTTDTRNVLTSALLSPIPTKISENSVRNYLLGAIILELAVVLLIVTNAAASAVTREKEDGSLDLLLTTPITSRYYIWGKLRGLISFVLPLLGVPVASVAIFVVYDLFRVLATGGGAADWIAYPESLIIMPAMLVIVAAFAAILGMQMSLRLRTSVMAVMTSVGIVVGACGALGWCGYTFLNFRNGGPLSLIVSAFSPFTVLTLLINPQQFAAGIMDGDNVTFGRVTVLCSSLAAVGIYTAIVYAMYRSMVKNFDMTIRRQSR